MTEKKAASGSKGSKGSGGGSLRMATESAPLSAPASTPATVAPRARQYLIAPRVGMTGQYAPMALDTLSATLDQMPDVRVLRRLTPRAATGGMETMAAGGQAGAQIGHIVVAEMSLEKGELLRANAPADTIIEHDELLKHAMAAPVPFMPADLHAATAPGMRTAVDVRLKIVDSNGKGVPRANVTVYGLAFPAQGLTDANGAVTLSVAGGPVESIRAIYVKPEANFWDRVIPRPNLVVGSANLIPLRAFSESFPNFPNQAMVGWGQRLMALDRIDAQLRGKGVRIGIIDSGCDNSHPQLRHVANGCDLVSDDGGNGWTKDEIHHGTHCAGIIGAETSGQGGIKGFAPAAEIHALKVFPGGRFSDLIEALDMAMDRKIDVINMSLGSEQASELVQQKFVAAVTSGITCIVAAGNSSGPVQFPGNLAQAITVAAVGLQGQYPEDSYHAQTVGITGAGGLFSAKFSCFGPEIRVSAPGVAIVSTVPGGGYASWDGTSMAAPHVTGLVALLLAHDPRLQALPRAARPAAVWDLLRGGALPGVPDPLRSGAGIPSAAPLAAGAVAAPPDQASRPASGTGEPEPRADAPGLQHGTRGQDAAAGAGTQVQPQMPQANAFAAQYAAQIYAQAAYQQAIMLRILQLRAAGLI